MTTIASRDVAPRARRLGGARVGDAVVDLVADELHAVVRAPVRERGQLGGVEHGAGRVGRAGDHQPLHRLVEGLEHRDRGLVAGLRPARQLDDLAAQRREDVAVAGVAGAGHGHAVARVERREEGQQEAAGAAGGHHDVLGGDVEAVGAAVVPGDRGAQRRDAQRDGVAEHLGRPTPSPRPRAPAPGAGVEGWPAERLTRSPWVRWRSPAAAQTSITWNGGMPARRAAPSCVVTDPSLRPVRERGWAPCHSAAVTSPAAARSAMSVRWCEPARCTPSSLR